MAADHVVSIYAWRLPPKWRQVNSETDWAHSPIKLTPLAFPYSQGPGDSRLRDG